jgi:drug/metabolite transporter (DMT)-like permease
MLYLLLSILLSVGLLLNFRLFPHYKVNTFQAIVLNYVVCFCTGLFFLPTGIKDFTIDFSANWTWMALGLGVGFIFTFMLSGVSTQKMGITATSLANNISLVIPVCFSLFILKTGKVFDVFNYSGLLLALVAVVLSATKKGVDSTQQPTSKWLVILPLVVFLMYGITNTMLNYMNYRYMPNPDLTIRVTLTMVLGAIVTGFALLGWRLVTGQERIEKQNLLAAVTLGIPNFLSFYTLLMALSAYQNNGAFVYPLYNIGVILTATAMAILFFRESLTLANKIGLLLAIIAICLISWQELL